MKNYFIYSLIFLSLITSCKKESNTSPVIFNFTPSQGSEGILVEIHGLRFDSVTDHITVSFNGTTTGPTFVSGDTLVATSVPVGATTGKITVTVNGKIVTSTNDFVILPDQWVSLAKPPFGSGRYWGIGFSIGDKGYIGMGWDGYAANDDLYEYDPSLNNWTKKSSMGKPLNFGVSFVINGKAYVGIGKTNLPEEFTNSFYEYDPALDKWTQKADFPGSARFSAVGFGIGTKGYVGLGGYGEKDWWEYDPVSNIWTRKADLDYSVLPQNASGFAVNNNGYVIGNFVTGPTSFTPEVLLYNAASDTWIKKNAFPGGTIFEALGVGAADKGFLIGDRGYWIYDPVSDSWDEKGMNSQRSGGAAFDINGKLYFGIGFDFRVSSP
ncbi:MAG: IPT/TIG domain-containing protein [Bacteroidetes bacterium]|nr:IPT/TIG domain-containing protein [Bacteroidota bacterium]